MTLARDDSQEQARDFLENIYALKDAVRSQDSRGMRVPLPGFTGRTERVLEEPRAITTGAPAIAFGAE